MEAILDHHVSLCQGALPYIFLQQFHHKKEILICSSNCYRESKDHFFLVSILRFSPSCFFLGPDQIRSVARLCPTLCDPMSCSTPGLPVPGILQARTLEWAAISFSNG